MVFAPSPVVALVNFIEAVVMYDSCLAHAVPRLSDGHLDSMWVNGQLVGLVRYLSGPSWFSCPLKVQLVSKFVCIN